MVIGIDADTRRVAWAAIEGGRVCDVGEVARTNTTGRFEDAYWQQLTSLVRRAQASGAVIYLESVYLPSSERKDEVRNVQTLIVLAEVQGEIKSRARQHGVPVVPVSAHEWRSVVLGRTVGRDELKRLAMEKARQLIIDNGQLTVELSEHMAEAVCIGLAGEAMNKEAK